MMDLKTFVEETLCQIAEGIQGAQERLQGSGATINPYFRVKNDGNYTMGRDRSRQEDGMPDFQAVNFDVAVTATEKDTGGGGFSVAVVMAKLGAGIQNEISNATVSRVQFHVVVDLPHQSIE